MLTYIGNFFKSLLGLNENTRRGQKRNFDRSQLYADEVNYEVMAKRRKGIIIDNSENVNRAPYTADWVRPISGFSQSYVFVRPGETHSEKNKTKLPSSKFEPLPERKVEKELEFKDSVKCESYRKSKTEDKHPKSDNITYRHYNGNRSHSDRERIKRSNTYQSVYDKIYNQPSQSSARRIPAKYKRQITAAECIRLEEKERYRQLIQQLTNSNLGSGNSMANSLFQNSRGSYNGFSHNYQRDVRTKPREPVFDKSSKYQSRRAFERSKLSSFDQFQCIQRISNLRLNQTKETPNYRDSSSSPEVIEVVDSSSAKKSSSSSVEILSNGSGPSKQSAESSRSDSPVFLKAEKKIVFSETPYRTEEWLKKWREQLDADKRLKKRQIEATEIAVKVLKEKFQNHQDDLETKIRENLRLAELEKEVIDESLKAEEEEEEQFPELTPEIEEKIEDALNPFPPDEVLVEAFRLQIRRRDMETLAGLNWLNDEIINFYMNLLIERGKRNDMPSVYSCNTFFYPKLLSGGHTVLKRWTRKIDIFSHDILLVPVHLGVHWCLAVVDFRNKSMKYYDSMGGKNNECLASMKEYLQAESLDKRKQEFDLSDWTMENVKDIPQQMNSSDCGMFACKYAEYITRNAKITFKQEHMPYFRRRMVYEILTQQLL